MPDRGKVIKGLEIHTKPNSRCVGCPYPNNGMCGDQLYMDALVLLKAQEPRVLILSEINKNSFVWYENKTCSRLFPALVADCQSITRHKFIVEDVFFDVGTYMPEDVHYGKSWRCWNYKPTDEQRKAVKWDDSD